MVLLLPSAALAKLWEFSGEQDKLLFLTLV